jgi:phosphonate transport system substrate-binding protein
MNVSTHKSWVRLLSLLIVISLGMAAGCSNSNRQSMIMLSDLQPLPAAGANFERPIGIAVVGVYFSEATIESYQNLAGYLSEKTGRTFELMLRPTYEEVNELVHTGVASLALVSSGAYVEGQRQFGMQLLVAPEINGKSTCFSYIIVPGGSPSQSLSDLKDTTFACTFPLSDTGRLAPSYALLENGASMETFFHRYTYTYSDEKSIKAISEYLYEGAAVNSLAYEQMSVYDPATLSRIRIVKKLGPYGISPIVIPPFLDSKLKEQIRGVLLSADSDGQGKDILRQLSIDRFVTVQDSAYDSVRDMAKKVWWTR